MLLRDDNRQRPTVSEFEVHKLINESRVTKSVCEGDIPGSLIKEFSPELSFPLTKIFNTIIESGEWPKKWKIETGIPIPKKWANFKF